MASGEGRGTTVLSDTFDSNHLDTDNWRHEITCWGSGNGEFQMYTPEAANTYIKNGELYLRPVCNLDLKDHQGHDQGLKVVYSTIHWGPNPGQHRHAGHWRKTEGGTWGDGYHTYSLDWDTDHIRMDVDSQPIFAWNTPDKGLWADSNFEGNNIWTSGGKDAPFDGKFSLILNVAVGGNFFNDGWINKGSRKPWKSNSSNAMVDFWDNKEQWQSTWHGDDTAMKIRSVKMIQY